MPVWHERIQREGRDDFAVVGITQEQHPDRCRLFAQWQGIDWPILWDPFNLTESSAVPIFLAIDEHGVVQRRMRGGPDLDWFFGEFLDTEHPFPSMGEPTVRVQEGQSGDVASVEGAVATLLWGDGSQRDDAVERLVARASQGDASPADRFRAGVAVRLRHDSTDHRPGDFQTSLDLWWQALEADPNQYIWRRRIQQWGPRLDKPYPFYGWIERAREEVTARGEEPVRVHVALTGSERAERAQALPATAANEVDPDPAARIDRDSGLVAIETAIAPHTGGAGGKRDGDVTARVHVVLRPDAEREVHWSNEAGPTQVWLDVPDGWRAECRLFPIEGPPKETSTELRRVDFEVALPGDFPRPAELEAYALYYVCEGATGECVYRRQDFVITLP